MSLLVIFLNSVMSLRSCTLLAPKRICFISTFFHPCCEFMSRSHHIRKYHREIRCCTIAGSCFFPCNLIHSFNSSLHRADETPACQLRQTVCDCTTYFHESHYTRSISLCYWRWSERGYESMNGTEMLPCVLVWKEFFLLNFFLPFEACRQFLKFYILHSTHSARSSWHA